jgi:hypothetical protein
VRERLGTLVILAAVLAAVLTASCGQEPYTLAPDTTDYGWRTVYETGGQRAMLRAVWVDAADDIWVGGEGGTFLHYDGDAWSDASLSPALSPEAVVYDIEGDGAGTLYAATSGGAYRYRGGVWDRIGDPTHALTVIGPDNVAAVQTPALVHFDGQGWSTLVDSIVPIPPDAMWASSISDVYIVDYESVFHYDGTASAPVLDMSRPLVDVWGTGPDDVFVGGYPNLLLHYDGTAWNPGFDPPYWGNHALRIAWGRDASNLWLARSDGDLIDKGGDAWVRYPAPIPSFIRGSHGREGVGTAVCGAYGVVMFHDGSEWSILRGRSPVRITAAWPLADGSVVVAYTWTAGVTRMARFDGEDWQELPLLELPEVVGLWGADVASLQAVASWGYSFHLEGDHWIDDYSYPHPYSVADAYATSGEDVVICGTDGVWRFDGDEWSDLGLTANDGDYFKGVWGDGAGSVVTVSSRGEACVLRDSVWTRTVIEPGITLDDVWMGTADFAVAIGRDTQNRGYRVYQFDGREWTVPPLGPGWSARQVVGRSRDDVFIVGVGTLYHFDGRYWSESSPLPALAGLVTGNGRIIGWSPTQLVEIDGR